MDSIDVDNGGISRHFSFNRLITHYKIPPCLHHSTRMRNRCSSGSSGRRWRSLTNHNNNRNLHHPWVAKANNAQTKQREHIVLHALGKRGRATNLLFKETGHFRQRKTVLCATLVTYKTPCFPLIEFQTEPTMCCVPRTNPLMGKV